MTRFAAIDFETADNGRDAACSVAVVVAENGRVVHSLARLIRPPRPRVMFTEIHGLTWDDVKDAPDFAGVWPELAEMVAGVDFLAAHNAAFDRRVLEGCCATYGLPDPAKPFLCTVQVARDQWNLRPTKLPDVARYLCLTLKHHDALSDATACANIVLAALEEGYDLGRRLPGF
ncbi:3'-5' exonuclease [Magnetospirillum aberrantis]|uniref:3'-5' exonuclease n=1 Tax=Magnetospirillum aberrantis SpK TaxID=908842 RepID=A0A7C9V139_9PROT|nr:3'-5' exonuclease [Magnetospirillum aberrantis]NFV81833.1 3'-5' exonuclease [Magnetospirillum aberrantis SpK]